jgi:hypothetical protein
MAFRGEEVAVAIAARGEEVAVAIRLSETAGETEGDVGAESVDVTPGVIAGRTLGSLPGTNVPVLTVIVPSQIGCPSST